MSNAKKWLSQWSCVVLESMQEECIKEVLIGNVVFMLFCYMDDIVLLAHKVEDPQRLMQVLENFCMHSELMVNVT